MCSLLLTLCQIGKVTNKGVESWVCGPQVRCVHGQSRGHYGNTDTPRRLQLTGVPAALQVQGLEWDLDTNHITDAHISPENGDDAIKTDIK